MGFFIKLFFQVSSVANCGVWFLNVTEHELSDFFDGISLKEKYRFRFDKKWGWGISGINGFLFTVLWNRKFVFFSV